MLCLIFSVSFDLLNMTITGVKKVYKLFKFVIVIDLHCVSCFCGLFHVEYHQNMCKKGFKNCLSLLGYERVYPSLCKVADTPFHIRGDIIQKYSYLWLISNLSVFLCLQHTPVVDGAGQPRPDTCTTMTTLASLVLATVCGLPLLILIWILSRTSSSSKRDSAADSSSSHSGTSTWRKKRNLL